MSIKNTFTLEELHCYVAPSVSVLACQNEGVLCASGTGNFAIKEWQNDGETLEF